MNRASLAAGAVKITVAFPKRVYFNVVRAGILQRRRSSFTDSAGRKEWLELTHEGNCNVAKIFHLSSSIFFATSLFCSAT